MLIDSPVKEHDIITLKLTSGEELIASFVRSTADTLIVSKPMTIAHNEQGMGLIPWIMTAPGAEKVEMNRQTIAAHLLSDKDIAKAYLQSTTSIQLTK